jgi:hypothetical protein
MKIVVILCLLFLVIVSSGCKTNQKDYYVENPDGAFPGGGGSFIDTNGAVIKVPE